MEMHITKTEQKILKLRQILADMHAGLDGMCEDGSDFYDKQFFLGWGGTVVSIPTGPESFDIFETAINQLTAHMIEEEDLTYKAPYSDIYNAISDDCKNIY